MASQKKEEPPKKKITSSRIVTMDSIRNRNTADNDELAYYAGGSEHSGQQVLGPGKRKRGNEDSNNLTEGNALAHALHRAAQSIRFEDDQPNRSPSPKLFGGVGYRLGDSHSPNATENGDNNEGGNRRHIEKDDEGANLENPLDDPESRLNEDNLGSPESHVTISDDNSIEILSDSRNIESEDDDDDDLHYVPGYASNEDEGGSPFLMIRNHSTGEEGEVYVNVTLYENGFTVDGGPLKSYDDPSCSKLIEYIKKGTFPSELIPEGSRRSVSVSVYDKREQQYTPPRTTLKAFSGKGHLLGSPTPAVSPVNSDTTESASTNHSNQQQPESTSFDFSTEVTNTTLKIRLPDGTVLQFTVNLNCSVANLRCFILKARPHLRAFEFSLMSTFPRREFNDLSETVEEAGLKNSCLVVQIT